MRKLASTGSIFTRTLRAIKINFQLEGREKSLNFDVIRKVWIFMALESRNYLGNGEQWMGSVEMDGKFVGGEED
jgi:hypothetical protein